MTFRRKGDRLRLCFLDSMKMKRSGQYIQSLRLYGFEICAILHAIAISLLKLEIASNEVALLDQKFLLLKSNNDEGATSLARSKNRDEACGFPMRKAQRAGKNLKCWGL